MRLCYVMYRSYLYKKLTKMAGEGCTHFNTKIGGTQNDDDDYDDSSRKIEKNNFIEKKQQQQKTTTKL